MITKNTNILYLIYPLTYLPIAVAGSYYTNFNFSNTLYILYALLPLALALCETLAIAIFKKDFWKNCSLARFSVVAFVNYAVSLILASVLTLAIRGLSNAPFVMGAWMILLTIFAVTNNLYFQKYIHRVFSGAYVFL